MLIRARAVRVQDGDNPPCSLPAALKDSCCSTCAVLLNMARWRQLSSDEHDKVAGRRE